MFEYHQILSSYRFRRNLGTGINRTRYYTIDSADGDIRDLYRAAVGVAREHSVSVADNGLCEPRRNEQGWIVAPSGADVRANAKATRRLLDTLRASRIDLQELGTGYSLAAYVLDADSFCCRILDDEGKVMCRWADPYVGRN